MKPFIPYARQDIDDKDIQTVVNILKSDWLTQGPVINEFEKACATYCGAQFGVAMSNATAALHVACLALDLGPGDILWTSPNTFVASANCALYCGAKVDFVDIDPKTYNMCPNALAEKLQWANKNNKLPKIIVVVHFAGQSCEMDKIKVLADQYGVKIIEDASHAIGGSYKDKKVGSCRYSDIAILSFHPVKIITTGEGGMLLTNSEQINKKAILLRSHGVTRDPEQMVGESEGPWYYEQVSLGYNFRITDIQAGLGLSQLQRIDAFVKRRNEIAKAYDVALKELPIVLPYQNEDCYSAFHLYPIQLKLDEIGLTRKEVFMQLREAGIGVNVHYIPVHTQPYYQKLGFKKGDFPVAEAYYNRTITIPLFYSMTVLQQDVVIECLSGILSQDLQQKSRDFLQCHSKD
jgi:UDP-4-amino-4,6-dideoxy-N-acetyl-beta-L-altrosamine transaminase